MNTTRFAIGLVALLMIASAAAVVLSDSEQTDAVSLPSWVEDLQYNSEIGFEMYTTSSEGIIVYIQAGSAEYAGETDNTGYAELKLTHGTSPLAGTVKLKLMTMDPAIVDDYTFDTSINLVTISFNMGAAPAMDPLVVSEGYEYALPTPSLTEGFSGWQINGEMYAPGQTVVITGSTEITAIYNGQPTLVDIGLVLNQEVYEVGDSPNVTVTAHWSDGTSTDVTAEAEISPETFTVDGNIEVSATYGGITETATVTVYLAETCTVTISIENSEYGTVEVDSDVITTEAVELAVPVGTEVVKDGYTLTIGEFTVRAIPNESDAQYTYACSWGDVPGSVTEDVEITLTFTRTLNEYTVTWYDEDGTTVLERDEGVSYGSMPEYDGETPTKDADAQYTYTFAGWEPKITAVTGDAAYRATYTGTVNKYAVTWSIENAEVTVTCDGSTVNNGDKVPYGSELSITVKADEGYSVTEGAVQTIKVEGPVEIFATVVINTYTVTWVNDDGTTVLERDEGVSYGSMPEYDGETPTKDADAQYTYTFVGWEPEVSEVKGDITYTAKFDANINKYTVTIADATNGTIIVKDDDSKVIQNGDKVDYGTHLVIEGVADTGYKLKAIYVDGDQAVDATVTSDVTISAEFVTEDTPVVFHSITVGYDGAMGSVSYPSTVADGNSANVYISAGFGYVIRSVTVDGVDVQLDSKLSQTVRLTNVTSDVTIVVTFEVAQQYTITVDAGRGSFLLPDGPYYEGRGYTVYIDAPLGYAVDVGGTVVTGSDDYEVYSNGTIVLGDMSDDVVITVSYKLTIVDDDDDDPVVPPVVVPADDDDTTTYIVAIAAAAVVAILAALILMQTRKS